MGKIGHARMSENGGITGVAGDSTGKEVAITDYYTHSKGWYVLRAIDTTDAEQIAKCMEDACANNCIGYCQNGRSTLYNAVKNNGFKCDKNSLKTKVEADCSSLVRVCLAYAGIKVADFYTGNEKDVLINSGKFKLVNWDGKEASLRRGDILVTKTKGHTAVYLSNGVATNTPTAAAPAVDYAQSMSKSLAGNYKTTANLNIRTGAGTHKKSLAVIPKGKYVVCYGYYTTYKGTKWYLVKYGNITGFCSCRYLRRS
jgi:hypothetical protein